MVGIGEKRDFKSITMKITTRGCVCVCVTEQLQCVGFRVSCRVLRWDLQTKESDDTRDSKGPKNFQTQKYCCVGKSGSSRKGVACCLMEPLFGGSLQSLGFRTFSPQCLEMSKHMVSLGEHPELKA